MAKERFMNNQEGKNKGRIAYVLKRDEIAKTVILKFEDTEDSKDSVKISYSTLKRWWKKVKEENVEQPPTELDNPVTEQEVSEEVTSQEQETETSEQAAVEPDSVAGDGTPYTEVMQEIIKDGKEAKKKVKSKAKKEKTPTVVYDECFKQINSVVTSIGYKLKVYENLPRKATVINSAGKRKYNIYLGSKKCVVSMPQSKVPEGKTPDRVRNCPMAAAFDVYYDNLDMMRELIMKEED